MALSSGVIVGYEILSRPTVGGDPIPLDELFAAAKLADSLEELDLRFFRQSLRAASDLTDSQVRLFINALPETLTNEKLLRALSIFRRKSQGTPSIVIEVCERTADPEAKPWGTLLKPIRSLGADVAIDDIGSGYAGLNRTVEMRPNWMKIDIGLIRGIDRDPMKAAMVDSVVAFARRLGTPKVVAEGVETVGEYRALREIGVEFGQGYAFARPEKSLVQNGIVALPGVSEEGLSLPPVDFAHFGRVLAECIQRASSPLGGGRIEPHQARQCIVEVVAADEVEVCGISGQNAEILTRLQSNGEPWLFPLPDAVAVSLQIGQESVTQSSEGLDRPFSLYTHCKSSVKVPIFSGGRLFGFIYCGFHSENSIRPDIITVLRGFAAAIGLGQRVGS